MRYIDIIRTILRNASEKDIPALTWDEQMTHLNKMRKRIDDVEIVVRCKDCKNWRESHSEDEESYCYIDGRTTDSTGYCSWGDRR